jgi:hypothetical protein
MNKKQKKKQARSWTQKRNHVPDTGCGPKLHVIFSCSALGYTSSVMTATSSKSAAKRWIKRNEHMTDAGPFIRRKCTKDFAADASGGDVWGADYCFLKRHPRARFWRHLTS